MTTPKPAQVRIPDDFSDFERSLVDKTEEAIVDGIQLESWTRDPARKLKLHPLDLQRKYNLVNHVQGYFANVQISGKTLTALGVLQQVEFGKITTKNPEELLKDYVLRLFLNTSNWTYDDGDAGGFTFKQMLYYTADGNLGRYPDDQLSSVQDWNVIGPRYHWSLFTAYLHDFVAYFGSYKHVFHEAVAVVQHPDFIHIVENPKPGYKLEVAIGYPFIDYAPVPNYFGWGPGKFDWAVKTYSFLLRNNNEVQCNMEFVAGRRARQVFNFGKYIPDPVYGTADLLKVLTLGLFPAQAVHDYGDLVMAAQHAKVHQALMEGSAKVFKAWINSQEQAA